MAQQEHRQHFPRPGWVEHDPQEIWRNVLSVVRVALEKADLSPSDLCALGIANQRETTVLWDRRSGAPVHNAINWQDTRTDHLCRDLAREYSQDRFREKTGMPVTTYFSGPKIRWLLDHIPGLRERAEAGEVLFGTIDSWLIWKLTGGRIHATDPSNASRTLLFNIARGEWDDDLLGTLNVPRELLPHVTPSSAMLGETDTNLFGRAIPIAGNAGDQQAALFGQACTSPGLAKNTYGTGCFMLLNTGREMVRSRNNLLTTVAWQLGDAPLEYALEGSVFIAGAAIQWLRDGLKIIDSAADSEEMALKVADNGGVYFVPAFVGLGAPQWDAYARGTMVGLTRGTTREHIARAALEAIAYQTADLLNAMRSDSGIQLSELRVDGGAARNNFLMQFQADVLGIPVVRPANTETTAAGAAYLAGLATGFWKNVEAIAEGWQRERVFAPQMQADERKRLLADWSRAIERASNWINGSR